MYLRDLTSLSADPQLISYVYELVVMSLLHVKLFHNYFNLRLLASEIILSEGESRLKLFKKIFHWLIFQRVHCR